MHSPTPATPPAPPRPPSAALSHQRRFRGDHTPLPPQPDNNRIQLHHHRPTAPPSSSAFRLVLLLELTIIPFWVLSPGIWVLGCLVTWILASPPPKPRPHRLPHPRLIPPPQPDLERHIRIPPRIMKIVIPGARKHRHTIRRQFPFPPLIHLHREV